MIWKLTNTLRQPLHPEWDFLLMDAAGGAIHEKRKNGFMLSREALQICLEELGQKPSIRDLTLLNFSTLKNHPEMTISLSHNPLYGAALVADRKIYRSVGIDIELKNRNVGPAIKAKISHPKDFPLPGLQFWCAKEATYKALMNTSEFSHTQNFSDIVLSEKSWFHIPSKIEGQYEVKTVEDNVLALAWIKI